MSGAGANFGELAADFGAALVDRAEAGFFVEEDAIAPIALLDRENLCAGTVGFDVALAGEASCDFLGGGGGGLVLGDELHPHEVG